MIAILRNNTIIYDRTANSLAKGFFVQNRSPRYQFRRGRPINQIPRKDHPGISSDAAFVNASSPEPVNQGSYFPVPMDPDSENNRLISYQRIRRLAEKSRQIVIQVSAVFPFDVFPDTIIVDINKVEIIHRSFFMTESVLRLLYADIRTVIVSSGPLFSALMIETSLYPKNIDPIGYLHRADAIRTCRIIMGLVMCEREKIDVTRISTVHLAHYLEEIGRARE